MASKEAERYAERKFTVGAYWEVCASRAKIMRLLEQAYDAGRKLECKKQRDLDDMDTLR